MKESIELGQEAKIEAHGFKKRLEGNINKLKTTLNQVNEIDREKRRMCT